MTLHSNPAAALSIFSDDDHGPPAVTLSAPESIQEFLDKYFKLPEEPLTDEIARSAFLRRAQQEISDLLATEGYFTPTISMRQRANDKKDLYVVEVDPGIQSRVEEIKIEFRGDIVSDQLKHRKRIKKIRAAWPLKSGDPFRSSDWEEGKAALLSRVAHEDYAAAQIVKSQATVDPESASVKLLLIIDSGPVFYFGDLIISGLKRYDESLVRNFTPFKAGDNYNRNLLNTFQLALQSVPHFNTVSVNIQSDVTQHKAAPVQVVVTEAPSQRISFGVGYSSNNGARGETNYSNHNFLDRAWNLSSTLRLEQKRQTFFAGIDTLPSEKNFRYSLGTSLQMTDIKNLKTITQRVGIARTYETLNTQRQLSLSWQREEKRPSGGINQTNTAFVLDWHWRYHKVDDPVHIRRGNVTEVRIGGGSKEVLSDQDFVRTYARHQSWWPIGKRDVLFLRGEAGYTLADSRVGIPQEYLFRAGGINSVRGYDFLGLGVREGNAIVGGRAMATGTVEYNYWVTNNWGAAFFADIGSAADSWQKFDPSIGYGAGIRWRSPAGPLALDLARAHETGNLRVHFSIGVVF